MKITHGQQLVIKAHARLGISKEHAKWCPVAVATYRFIPEVTLNQEMLAKLSTEQKQQLVDVCPDRILRIDEVTGQLELDENYEDMATFTEDLHYAQLAMKSRPEDEDFVTVKQVSEEETQCHPNAETAAKTSDPNPPPSPSPSRASSSPWSPPAP